jgi:hypothetical protein
MIEQSETMMMNTFFARKMGEDE